MWSWFRPTKPETRNRHLKLVSAPKPETRNRHLALVSAYETRNLKPETRNRHLKLVSTYETPKPETRNRHLNMVSTYETRNPKNRHLNLVSTDETRNPKLTSDMWSWFRPTKPETRNRHLKLVSAPKPETRKTDIWSWFRPTKPETRNRHLKLVSIDETRNPKPTSKFGFDQRNPKPETRKRLESDFWGSSLDRNSKYASSWGNFWYLLRKKGRAHELTNGLNICFMIYPQIMDQTKPTYSKFLENPCVCQYLVEDLQTPEVFLWPKVHYRSRRGSPQSVFRSLRFNAGYPVVN